MFLPSGLGYLKPCLGSACLVNSLSPFASILCVSLFRRNGERIFTQYIKPLPYPCVSYVVCVCVCVCVCMYVSLCCCGWRGMCVYILWMCVYMCQYPVYLCLYVS